MVATTAAFAVRHTEQSGGLAGGGPLPHLIDLWCKQAWQRSAPSLPSATTFAAATNRAKTSKGVPPPFGICRRVQCLPPWSVFLFLGGRGVLGFSRCLLVDPPPPSLLLFCRMPRCCNEPMGRRRSPLFLLFVYYSSIRVHAPFPCKATRWLFAKKATGRRVDTCSRRRFSRFRGIK